MDDCEAITRFVRHSPQGDGGRVKPDGWIKLHG